MRTILFIKLIDLTIKYFFNWRKITSLIIQSKIDLETAGKISKVQKLVLFQCKGNSALNINIKNSNSKTSNDFFFTI